MCIKSVTRPNDDELLNHTEKLDLNFDYNDHCFYHEEEINLGYNVSDLSVLHLNIRGLVSKQRTHKKGGGVAILVSDYLKFRRRSDLEQPLNSTENCIVEVDSGKTNIHVCALYRPPNSDESQFLELIETLTKNRKINTIIGLDHNLDLLKAHKHKTTQTFIDKILNHDHLPVITKPTRITKSTATLIDNIVISQKLQSNYHCGILIDDISDHLPCFIRIENVKPGLKTPEVRKYRKLNDDAISEINVSLKECDWSELTNRDCSSSFDYFHQKLTDIIDSHAPEKEKNCIPQKTN